MGVRTLAVAAAVTIALGAAPRAFAACPEGDWFCDDSQPGPAEPSEPPVRSEPGLPPARERAPVERPSGEGEDDAVRGERRRTRAWPPVVYPPSGGLKRATYPRERKRVREPDKRFGLNGHANFALFDNDPHRHRRASMQGIGASFRFRPIPVLGLDLGPELMGGRDYNGDERLEVGVLANALLFFAPSKRFELHVLGGFGFSSAFVREDVAFAKDRIRRHGYVGLDFGFGLEWYVTPRVALGAEVLAFVRSRDDAGRPEFVDPETNRATNTSTGALVRPGVTVYF